MNRFKIFIFSGLSLIIAAISVFLLINFSFFSSDIYLTTFDDYINPDLVKKFEQESGLKVHIDTINTNEEMKSQLLLNPKSYDVIIASDYMVMNLSKNKLIKPIEWNKLALGETNSQATPAEIQKDFLAAPLYSQIESYSNKLLDYGIPYFWQDLSVTYNYSDYASHGAIMPPPGQVNNKTNDHWCSHWNWVQTLDFLITGNPYYTVSKTGTKGDRINIFNQSKHYFRPQLDFNNDLRNLLLMGSNIENVINKTNNPINVPSDVSPANMRKTATNSYNGFMNMFSAKDQSDFKIRPIKRMDQTQADDFSFKGKTHANAMFGYNGDALSSFFNIDDDSQNTIKKSDYAFILPSSNNTAIDEITLSSQISHKRTSNVYKFINFLERPENQMSNFDFVNYMPIGKKLYNKLNSPSAIADGGYFEGEPLIQKALVLPENYENYFIYNDISNAESYSILETKFDSLINNSNFFISK